MVAPTSLALLCAVLGAGDVVLLDFGATWCGPCQQMHPVVDRLSAAGYPIRKVDVDREPQLAEQFQVRGVPCFVLLVGGREADRLVGPASYDRLAQMIDRGRNAQQPAANPANQFAVPTAAPPSTAPSFARGSALAAQAATSGADAFPANSSRPAAPFAATPRRLPAHLTGGAFDRAPPPQMASAQPRPAQWPVAGPNMSPAAPIAAPTAAPMAVAETSARGVGESAVERAMAATVKLEVEDPKGTSFGTGTIVDRQGNESLVVTCGHIFRDSQGRGQIKVYPQALRGSGPSAECAGRVVHFDLERDIALVVFRSQLPVGAVQVVAAGYVPQAGEPTFSIGCNKGGDPSVMQGRVMSLGKCTLRPAGEAPLPLLEVSGRPIDGRSGGGLFTADGRLAGVCNFADQDEDKGLYACPTTIHTELDRNNLARVYQRAPDAMLAGANAPAAPVSPPASPAIGNPVGGQMTFLVSMPTQGGANQTIVIERPSPALLEILAREAQTRMAANPVPAMGSTGTIVRGQNGP